jgi:predicted TIM-barrel fold metal-dependent hydrolase
VKVTNAVLQPAEIGNGQLVEQLDEAFEHRLLWGSDFPHTVGNGYASLANAARSSARRLTPEARDRFLHANAAALFHLRSRCVLSRGPR